jgi:hypothetical protein
MDMNSDVFWRVIGLFDWKQVGDDEAVMRRAIEALACMNVTAINSFSDLLASLLHTVDTREHCRYIYRGEFEPDDERISPDDFLYKRCDLVANGRNYYELVLVDPTQIIQDCEFEAILNLNAMAYEKRHGDAYEYVSPICYESFTNKDGWPSE